MNSKTTYYTPPTDEVFNEIKMAAIEVWSTYDNTYGYVDEKVNSIKDIGNIKDNAMYIHAMFDMNDQSIHKVLLSIEARDFIEDRIKRGQQ